MGIVLYSPAIAMEGGIVKYLTNMLPSISLNRNDF